MITEKKKKKKLKTLTSSYWPGAAPNQPLMLLMSLLGPMIREVPESTTASQPPEHATVFPLMVMLKHTGSNNGKAASM